MECKTHYVMEPWRVIFMRRRNQLDYMSTLGYIGYYINYSMICFGFKINVTNSSQIWSRGITGTHDLIYDQISNLNTTRVLSVIDLTTKLSMLLLPNNSRVVFLRKHILWSGTYAQLNPETPKKRRAKKKTGR